MYDVFISYNHNDRALADFILAELEKRDVKAFMAPMSIPGGADWAEAITQALHSTRVFVLLFSKYSNASTQVKNEVAIALKYCDIIMPLRLDRTMPTGSMEYHLSSTHWFNEPGASYSTVASAAAERIKRIIDTEQNHDDSEPQPAAEKPAEKAMSAGFLELRGLAEGGNTQAQCGVADCYYYGSGVERSYSEACRWYERAAESGDAYAQYSLGWCLLYGRGTDKSPNEATRWLKKSAEQSEPLALQALAQCYFSGRGVPQDDARGIALLREACEKSYAARLILGKCLLNGTYTEKDAEKGFELIKSAAESNSAKALEELADCYYHGRGTQADPTAAAKIYRRLSDKSDSALFMLANCYHFGHGVPLDHKEGAYLYERAAKKGVPTAMHNLGVCYEHGEGVEKNTARAYEWYLKAAEAGRADDMIVLAKAYYFGNNGYEKDMNKALEWALKGARAGSAEGQVLSAKMLHAGDGAPKDEAAAYEWAKRAAAQGDTDGMILQSDMLNKGDGVKKDRKAAFKLLLEAADAGNVYAQASAGAMLLGAQLGSPVPKDLKKGAEYTEKAAAQQSATAERVLSLAYTAGRYGYPKDILKGSVYGLRMIRHGGPNTAHALMISMLLSSVDEAADAAFDDVEAERYDEALARYREVTDALNEAVREEKIEPADYLPLITKLCELGANIFDTDGKDQPETRRKLLNTGYDCGGRLVGIDPSQTNRFRLAWFACNLGIVTSDPKLLAEAEDGWRVIHEETGGDSSRSNADIAHSHLEKLLSAQSGKPD